MTATFYTIALTTCAWALWIRRGTWRIVWERPITLAIALLVIALALVAPWHTIMDDNAHWLTGRWHVTDVLGHGVAIGALISSTYAGMLRIPRLRARAKDLLQGPISIAFPIMLMLYWNTTRYSHDPTEHILQHRPHCPWVIGYFTALYLTLGYYGALNAWCAIVLRKDPRSKPAAYAWLFAMTCSMAAMLILAFPWLACDHWYDYMRDVMCAAATLFAYSSGRSWQRKLKPYRRLIHGTGARWGLFRYPARSDRKSSPKQEAQGEPSAQ